MSKDAGLPRGAAPTFRSGARRPHDSYQVLSRLSDRMDGLLRDVAAGPRSQREWERLANEAEAIADRLRATFREPTPVNPPRSIEHRRDGSVGARW